MQMNNKLKLHFRGLTGLRFFAAFFVVIYHASTFVTQAATPNVFDFRPYSFFNNGPLAVNFFFVLSGFLITSLLINEQNATGKISIKKFYIRRSLRIWPLYYLIVFVGIIVMPLLISSLHIQTSNNYNTNNWLLYLFFLPNFLMQPSSIILSPLWSIGVEEQFYLLIAPAIKFLRKYLATIFISIICFKLILNVWFSYMAPEPEWKAFYTLISGLKFEIISIGGLGALLIQSNYYKILSKVFRYLPQISILLVLAIILFARRFFSDTNIPVISGVFTFLFSNSWSEIFIALFFLYVILSVSLNEKSIIHTDNKLLNWLGNISYGIYMYHILAELTIIRIFQNTFDKVGAITATVLYYLSSIILTIFIAHVSFILFEKKFLKLKQKFE